MISKGNYNKLEETFGAFISEVVNQVQSIGERNSPGLLCFKYLEKDSEGELVLREMCVSLHPEVNKTMKSQYNDIVREIERPSSEIAEPCSDIDESSVFESEDESDIEEEHNGCCCHGGREIDPEKMFGEDSEVVIILTKKS